jgi:hypothetical protein
MTSESRPKDSSKIIITAQIANMSNIANDLPQKLLYLLYNKFTWLSIRYP